MDIGLSQTGPAPSTFNAVAGYSLVPLFNFRSVDNKIQHTVFESPS